jgi:hypothetical protein
LTKKARKIGFFQKMKKKILPLKKKIFPLKKKQREKNFAFKKKTKGKKKKYTEFCVAVFWIYFRLYLAKS